jgi:hypothetical protein
MILTVFPSIYLKFDYLIIKFLINYFQVSIENHIFNKKQLPPAVPLPPAPTTTTIGGGGGASLP